MCAPLPFPSSYGHEFVVLVNGKLVGLQVQKPLTAMRLDNAWGPNSSSFHSPKPLQLSLEG